MVEVPGVKVPMVFNHPPETVTVELLRERVPPRKATVPNVIEYPDELISPAVRVRVSLTTNPEEGTV